MPAKPGLTKKDKLEDVYGEDPVIGATPLLDSPCAACGGKMREGEPRITDPDPEPDGTSYHPEHYAAE